MILDRRLSGRPARRRVSVSGSCSLAAAPAFDREPETAHRPNSCPPRPSRSSGSATEPVGGPVERCVESTHRGAVLTNREKNPRLGSALATAPFAVLSRAQTGRRFHRRHGRRLAQHERSCGRDSRGGRLGCRRRVRIDTARGSRVGSGKIEVAADLRNHGLSDRPLVERKSRHQRVVAHHADRPGNAAGASEDRGDRLRREHRADVAPGHTDTLGHVVGGLAEGERRQRRTKRHSLFQLLQRTLVEPGGQLGLADEHHREELFVRRFAVRQQSHFLQERVGHRLRFVDDERRHEARRRAAAAASRPAHAENTSSSVAAASVRPSSSARNSKNS